MNDDIPDGPPLGFNPKYFVVAKFNSLFTGYDNSISGVYPTQSRDVITFANLIRTKSSLGSIYSPLPIIETTSFAIWGHCYILFVMPDGQNFAGSGPGMKFMTTLPTETIYADLYEIDGQGNSVSGSDVNTTDCTVAYFSAVTFTNPPQAISQRFNILRYNNPAFVTALSLVTVIDPDVKNDGTSPQWP